MTPGAAPRRLAVVRHAKAEAWGESDHARALTGTGRREAALAGEFLAAQGLVPDLALVSDATRTRQTWAALAEAAAWGVEPRYDRAVYTAGSDAALDLLRALGDATTVVLLGHNPTVASLAHLLDDGAGEEPASTDLLVRGFPTSAAVVLDVPGEWRDLGPAGARVLSFHAGHAAP